MAGFDASGNFTRVHNWQQDRDNGIRILADRHDAEDDNFANAFNVTFLRTGTVPMTGNLVMGGNSISLIEAGVEAAPSVTWELSNSTGIWQPNPSTIAVSSNGIKKFEVNGTGVGIFGDTVINGAAGSTKGFAVGGALRVGGTDTTGLPQGPAVEILHDGTNGFVASYDRAAATYKDLFTKGTNLYLQPQGGITMIQAATQGATLYLRSQAAPAVNNHAAIYLETLNSFNGVSQSYIRANCQNAGNADMVMMFGLPNPDGTTIERMRITSFGVLQMMDTTPFAVTTALAGSADGFVLYTSNGDGGQGAPGSSKARIGMYYGAYVNECASVDFRRGNSGTDGSIALRTGSVDRLVVDVSGNIILTPAAGAGVYVNGSALNVNGNLRAAGEPSLLEFFQPGLAARRGYISMTDGVVVFSSEVPGAIQFQVNYVNSLYLTPSRITSPVEIYLNPGDGLGKLDFYPGAAGNTGQVMFIDPDGSVRGSIYGVSGDSIYYGNSKGTGHNFTGGRINFTDDLYSKNIIVVDPASNITKSVNTGSLNLSGGTNLGDGGTIILRGDGQAAPGPSLAGGIEMVQGADIRMMVRKNSIFGINTAAVSAAQLDSGKSFQVGNEILSKGGFAGLFAENRAGGVSATANWFGWYMNAPQIYLHNGTGTIGFFNSSTGAYTVVSDKEKKRDIEEAPDVGLEAIKALKVMRYRMIDGPDDAPMELGLIAQDVAAPLPEAYDEHTGPDINGKEQTFIGLKQMPIIAALINSVQELEARLVAGGL
jgi:hypothetical protein